MWDFATGKSPKRFSLTRPRKSCPARDSTRHECRKKCHFAAVCLSSKRVHTIETEINGFVGSVTDSAAQSNWEITVLVQGKPIQFKMRHRRGRNSDFRSSLHELLHRKPHPSTEAPSSRPRRETVKDDQDDSNGTGVQGFQRR